MRASLIITVALLAAGCAREQPGAATVARALTPPGLEALVEAYGLPGHVLERASLGRRYRMLLVRTGQHGTWDRAVVPLQVWRAPLLVDGDAVALVTLAHHEGKMQAVELGAEALARELGAMEPPGGELAILRSYDLGADFLVISTGGARRFRPLSSARRALGIDGATISEERLMDLLGRPSR